MRLVVRYSSRIFLYAPFVILLTIATIAMLQWWHLATQWQAKLQAANRGEEIAPGVTLHFGSENISGFPFNLDVVLDGFVLSVQSTRGPISLASEHFAIHALTYGRAQQILEAAGTQNLKWTDAEGGTHRLVFVPGTMRASAIESGGRLARFDLDLNALASPALTAARAQLHIRAVPDHDLLDFVILADGVRAMPPDEVVSHLDLAGQITPTKPLWALLSGRDEWRHAIVDWRVVNGTFHLKHVEISGHDSRLTASGALGFDDANRLSGTLRMQLSNAAHWMPTRMVQSRLTFALQGLASTASNQIASPLSLSLDIHNGAAIVRASGKARNAGLIAPMF